MEIAGTAGCVKKTAETPTHKTGGRTHTSHKAHAPWMGTQDQFEAEVKKLGLALEVLKPEVGKAYTLTK